MKTRLLLLLLAVTLSTAPVSAVPVPDLAQLKAMTARYAPTPLRVDISKLTPGNRQALRYLIEAASVIDSIFLEQLWSGNERLRAALRRDHSPLGKARLHYFWINKGPWSTLDDQTAFLPHVPARRPPGANFYPVGMTAAQFDAWVKTLPTPRQAQARGYFTVIRNAGKGGFAAVPYSEAYRAKLAKAANLLRQAADVTPDLTLAKYLRSRATAFSSNDYLASDFDWLDVDSPLEVTIGPYETYNDELFGFKAAFEAFVLLRDDAATRKLAALTAHLQAVEDNLPEDPSYRNPKLGAAPVIRVGNLIVGAGDGNHGVQLAAFNLPNDVRITRTRGTKRVMLENMQQAKFGRVLVPIAARVLAPSDRVDVAFDAFFTHILVHELMHGLGPHNIKVAGQETTVALTLKDLRSTIEEAKADVSALFALRYLMDRAEALGLGSVLPHDEAAYRRLYTTYLASMFRSMRFGLNESHARGTAMQLNWLLDEGGCVISKDGTFSVDFARVAPAVESLTRALLTIEAQGDYAGAKALIERLSVVRAPVRRALDGLKGIPVDLEPEFVTADEVLRVSR